MTDTSRIYAIVVGIESYTLGQRWNLKGPASDALDCVEWLQNAGVPNSNISLLMAPTAERMATLMARADALGFDGSEIVQPTKPNVDRVFKDIKAVNGDLLFVFWGGHGVVDALKQRALLCMDATKDDGCEFMIDLECLKLSSKVTKFFPEQIFMIDACANFSDTLGWNTGITIQIPAGLKLRSNVRQAMIFACATGKSAGQNQAEGYGEFSRVMLNELRQPGGTMPPDMDVVAKRVTDHFELLCLEDDSIQRPVYCTTQGFDQNSAKMWANQTHGGGEQQHDEIMTLRQRGKLRDALLMYEGLKSQAQRTGMVSAIWPLGSPSLTRSLDDEIDLENCLREVELKHKFGAMFDWLNNDAANGLETELVAVTRFQVTYDAISTANSIRKRLTNLNLTSRAVVAAFDKATVNKHSTFVPRNLAHALEKLLLQKPDPATRHIGHFLLYLERECAGDEKIATALLDEWSIDVAEAAELRHGLSAPQQIKQPRLIVDFHGPERAHTFRGWPDSIGAWLQLENGDWSPLYIRPSDGTFEGAQRAFHEIFTWAQASTSTEVDVSVELMVPRCLFDSDFEKWIVKETPYTTEASVGERCNVVLRWGERYWVPQLQKNWLNRSESINEALKFADPEIHWVLAEQERDSRLIRNSVSTSEDTHCVGFEFPLPEAPEDLGADPVVAALQTGVAYSILFSGGGDVNRLKNAVSAQLKVAGISQFPESLKKLRLSSCDEDMETSAHLIALWDDPFDLPPHINATEPK